MTLDSIRSADQPTMAQGLSSIFGGVTGVSKAALNVATKQAALPFGHGAHAPVYNGLDPLWWIDAHRSDLVSDGSNVSSIKSPDPQCNDLGQFISGQLPTISGGVVTLTSSTQLRPNSKSQYIKSFSLPSAAGAAAGKGFTNTGLSQFSDGTFVCGNHGLDRAASSPQTASVVHLSADFATALHEALGSTFQGAPGTIQATCVDPTDQTIWVASSDENKIYHMHSHLSGTWGQMIGSPLTYTGANGIAVDTLRNELIVIDETNLTASWLNKATGAVTLTGTFPATNGNDQLQFDPAYGDYGGLWMTQGASGNAGYLFLFTIQPVATDATKRILIPTALYQLKEVRAIEGVAIVRANDGSVWAYVGSDAWFHNSHPFTNRIMLYQLQAAAAPEYRTKTTGVLVVKGAAASGLAAFLSVGFAADTGYGLSVNIGTTANQLRFRLKGRQATSTSYNFTLPDITAKSILSFEYDSAAKTLAVYQNGSDTALATLSTTATIGDLCKMPVTIGGRIDGGDKGGMEFDFTKGIGDISYEIRKLLEGEAAWASGLVGLLASDHSHKVIPPA